MARLEELGRVLGQGTAHRASPRLKLGWGDTARHFRSVSRPTHWPDLHPAQRRPSGLLASEELDGLTCMVDYGQDRNGRSRSPFSEGKTITVWAVTGQTVMESPAVILGMIRKRVPTRRHPRSKLSRPATRAAQGQRQLA